jgi:ArsR family transcriptional regulator, arsenate/arsenite/antimonite-responsive transcriptional repressor
MDKSAFTNEEVANLARWLKVIGEPNRLLLLEKIIEGVQCNCELGNALQLAPNLISHHLSVLREAGLIEAEHDPVDSRWVYYSINPKAMDELWSLLGEYFDMRRIQPRGATCGPQITEEQRQSLLRMTHK